MTVEETLALLEENVAPVKLSDEFCARYKMYDNSGIIINCGREVNGALFSLDLSEAAVNAAIDKGYNLIVTHHPAIYGGISRFDLQNSSQSRALAECLKRGISVISMHLNFDAAERGIDYYLMRGLGGSNPHILSAVEGGGYGRVYDIQPVACGKFIEDVKNAFSTKRIIFHGEENRTVKRVASFCGAGLDDEAVAFAKSNKADVAVSSDLSHHRISELVESGTAVLQLTHYCAESYGFGEIYKSVKMILGIPSSFYLDERFV